MTYRDAAAFDDMPPASEHDEQVALFRWAALHEWHEPRLGLLYAIPNGGARHPAVAAKLKAEGVKPGVPDIMLACRGRFAPDSEEARYDRIASGLFVELKRTRGGVVSPEQRAWHDRLRRQDYRVEVCKGWQAGAVVVADYLDRLDLVEWVTR